LDDLLKKPEPAVKGAKGKAGAKDSQNPGKKPAAAPADAQSPGPGK
jgi:hypothetical protein